MNPNEKFWERKSNQKQTAERCRRQKSRVVVQYAPDEKQAIDWLSRCPDNVTLPQELEPLRKKAARVIAKTLDWPRQMGALVDAWEIRKAHTR